MKNTPFPTLPNHQKALLAGVMLEPERLPDLAAILDESHFDRRNRLIYRALLAITDQGIDLRTLEAELDRRGELETVGGIAYLHTLDLELPDLTRLDLYAQQLRDRASRNQIADLAARLEQTAREGDTEGPNAQQIAGEARRLLERIEESGGTEARPAADLLPDVLADLEGRYAEHEKTGRAVLGLRSGIPGLDSILGGLRSGLYVLAGPPGVGKTTLAQQIALEIAERDQAVAVYVTFENSARNLIQKSIAARADQNSADVLRGFVKPGPLRDAAARLRPALRRLLILEGNSSWSVAQVRAAARRAMEQAGVDRAIVILDYLQIAAAASAELRGLADNRAKVDALLGDLIDLGRRLDAPVLAISSQSRAAGAYGDGGGQANLSSLKESGGIEYGADAVLFVTPADRPTSGAVRPLDLTVGKNRHGPTGKVPMIFRPDRGIVRQETADA